MLKHMVHKITSVI